MTIVHDIPAPHRAVRAAARGGAHRILAAVLVCLCPAPALAQPDPFTVLDAERVVDSSGFIDDPEFGPFEYSERIDTLATGVFDETAQGDGGTASQLSTLTPIELSGTGDIALGWGGYLDSTQSLLNLEFEVVQGGSYALTGQIDQSSSFGDLGETSVSLIEGGALFGSGGIELFSVQSVGSFEQAFLLQPGTKYSLRANTYAFSEGVSASSSWSFDLVPVPEPGSGMLVGLGLLLLARRRRS